jgi:dTDP-4-dehydrorhamnose reductase
MGVELKRLSRIREEEKNMKIAITGAKGNIGSRLVKDYGYIPLDADIRHAYLVESAITKVNPDIIIHLAGKSNVNWCEAQENQEAVQQINFRGSNIVFEQAANRNIPVVFVSSDHIFSGKGFGSYKETDFPTENSLPVNQYGKSKLAAEGLTRLYQNVHVVRTSTNFWAECPSISSIFSDISAGRDVYMPVYLWRSFLHIDHFCQLISCYCLNINDTPPKILNLSGSKVVSWHRFISDYAEAQGLDTSKVHPKYFEDRNHDFAPRAYRAGLNTNLSKKLGYPQFSYLDGIN